MAFGVWRFEIVNDARSNDTILGISVRGKRGVGYCKSMPGAVHAFERLRDRLRPSEEEGRRHRGPFKKDKRVSGRDRKPEPTDLLPSAASKYMCGEGCRPSVGCLPDPSAALIRRAPCSTAPGADTLISTRLPRIGPEP